MQKQTLTCIIVILTFCASFAQANRTFDGSNNNLNNPEWGAVNTNLIRVTDIAYSNGFSSPAGTDRPNPREISNAVFAQSDLVDEPRNLSCYIWSFGQFLDHDIDLTHDEQSEFEMIEVPEGDPWFDPMSTGSVMIPMKRSKFDDDTGTSIINPRQHPNEISTYIDGSNVYGSDKTSADWLRSFEDGKLKVSAGNLLPFNTTTGLLDDPIDPNTPAIDDAVGTSPKLFVAGDSRVNENVLLISFHTLFVREHNRLCDEIKIENPTWDDEEIYQYARKKVGGYIQSITYNEFLPSLGITLPEYSGYDDTVNPAIMNIFSGSAFRLHSLINTEILRVDNEGNPMPQGHLSLMDAFFNPMEVVNGGGIDPLFKGMATLVAQDFDTHVVDDLRSFLFGAPGAGGLDLASININRGRERGFPDFNTIRENFGLEPYTSFDQICSNPDVAAAIEDVYESNIDNIDSFVGFVAEDHMNDGLLGETVSTIIAEQFRVLRDGDRYFFWNDPVLTTEEKNEINETRLVDIVMRNTNVDLMQGNLFSAMDHGTLVSCGAASPNVSIQGDVMTEFGTAITNVELDFHGSNFLSDCVVNIDGNFEFNSIPSCYDYTLIPAKRDNPLNGVSTYDLVLMQSHVLGVNELPNPYRLIAADVNADGNITTFDIVELRQLILALIPDFQSNSSWRFVDANQTFANPNNPFETTLAENYYINSLTNDITPSFVGIKIGDVNGDADPAAINNVDNRNLTDQLIFRVEDRSVAKGQTYTVDFKATNINQIVGYQFTLNFDTNVLEFMNVKTGKNMRNLGEGNFGVFAEEGMITTSWNGTNEMREDDIIFSLQFKAKASGNLRDLLSINSRLTRKEAISDSYELQDIALQFDGVDGSDETLVLQDKFEVYQNFPNPFEETTKIGFYLPKASTTTITITDVAGKTLQIIAQDFEAGYNKIDLNRAALNASGVLSYEVNTDFGTISKKMILID